MKPIVYAALIAFIATPSFAGSYETRCKIESVPYQVSTGAKPEEVLGGALIGGVLGKAATGDNGGAAVGAIIGGAVANEKGKKTVTKYRDVETCREVYVPSLITDDLELRQSILLLNNGGSESKERTKDVQYTIGVRPDGKWGPKSTAAANDYLQGASVDRVSDVVIAEDRSPLYSLMVNDVVVVSSPDVNAIDEIKQGLYRAGVDSTILVDVQ
jgi:gas vesicle protein